MSEPSAATKAASQINSLLASCKHWDELPTFQRLQNIIQTHIDDTPLTKAVKSLSKDMHNISKRPCSTCQAITDALGEPFGCVAYRFSSTVKLVSK